MQEKDDLLLSERARSESIINDLQLRLNRQINKDYTVFVTATEDVVNDIGAFLELLKHNGFSVREPIPLSVTGDNSLEYYSDEAVQAARNVRLILHESFETGKVRQ